MERLRVTVSLQSTLTTEMLRLGKISVGEFNAASTPRIAIGNASATNE
jgi:hypothetical protein